ncbi:MAG: ACP S-malonyltransferase [Gammaproteobacteria bacterium]|nr:ACP S-malonyltransferase [Gammaproteobacteria bacterium]
MTSFAYVFPGQGSQSVGMMTEWGEQQPIVNEVYAQASEVLGYDLWSVTAEGPLQRLNQTEVTQPAMLCAGVASWRIASQQPGMPAAAMMAGHSLGEYSALVCAGSLALRDAAALVARRGQLMQSAVGEGEGAMAAIIGLDDRGVREACASVASGVVEAVNFNAPGQVVIAGEADAVEAAMAKAKELGAKRALPLPVSVPSHCSLMRNAAEQLAAELEAIDIKPPSVPVIHNHGASVASSVDEIRERLKLQLYSPVEWVASVQGMQRQGVNVLIECGPGKVLTGLTRRIEKSMQAFAIFDAASCAQSQQSIGDLQNAE